MCSDNHYDYTKQTTWLHLDSLKYNNTCIFNTAQGLSSSTFPLFFTMSYQSKDSWGFFIEVTFSRLFHILQFNWFVTSTVYSYI